MRIQKVREYFSFMRLTTESSYSIVLSSFFRREQEIKSRVVMRVFLAESEFPYYIGKSDLVVNLESK